MASTIQHHDPSHELIFSFFISCEHYVFLYCWYCWYCCWSCLCFVQFVELNATKWLNVSFMPSFGFWMATLPVDKVDEIQNNKTYIYDFSMEQKQIPINFELSLFCCVECCSLPLNLLWSKMTKLRCWNRFHLYLLINCKFHGKWVSDYIHSIVNDNSPASIPYHLNKIWQKFWEIHIFKINRV